MLYCLSTRNTTERATKSTQTTAADADTGERERVIEREKLTDCPLVIAALTALALAALAALPLVIAALTALVLKKNKVCIEIETDSTIYFAASTISFALVAAS